MAGVFWIGNNGNTYYKSGTGGSVQDLGTNPVSSRPDLAFALAGAKQISNPSSGGGGGGGGGAVQGAVAPAYSGGGGGASVPVLNRAAVDNTQRTIDQIPGLLQAALEAEGTSYGNVVGGFNAAEGAQRGTYDKSTTTNQLNYDSNFMDSIRSGIKGLGGLMSLLRGTGAGGGTAEDQARDAVGGVTSQDIRTGADTQKENQGTLDSALSAFLTELQTKRKAAEDTRINNERAIKRDTNTQLQDLFGKMAGFYGEAGDAANANSWMARAGALTPEIAANSRTQVSAYDTTPVAIKAPELTAFADPTQPAVVVAPEGQVGSGIFTMNERRRREPAQVPVGV